MSEQVDFLTPIIAQLGVGGVGGLCVGYALKKIAKITAVIIGVGFLVLQYLAYEGIITIDYGALKDWALGLTGQASGLMGVLTSILANLPFASSFIVGFVLGFKKG